MTETAYPASTLPEPMDVVWCRFPYDETPGKPGDIAHPALVFEVMEYREGKYAVRVAFGTSNMDRGDKAMNFQVSNFAAQRAAGLAKETFFDLGRVKTLVWTDRWFESPDPKRWSTPVIGQIGADGQEYLRAVLERRKGAGLTVP